jgi:hypothetical protein
VGEQKIINPNTVLLSNQGYIKIDDYEIAELKSLEIKIVPETKEINLLNSVTKGKLITNVSGVINFEFNKIYSRFIPAVLESSKYLQLFTFSLEATVYSTNKKDEERLFIGNCWLEGDIELISLKSDTELLTQKFQAGFQVESASFENVLTNNEDEENDNDWSTQSYW